MRYFNPRWISRRSAEQIFSKPGVALAWLEQAYQQRDQRMTFLKVEPKWNNLRDDPRFKDLMRQVGF